MLVALTLGFVLGQKADVTFVRHAETLANSTGRYNARTLDTFSPKGQEEVDYLTQWLLKQPKFDTILVSPSRRAMLTIEPYLKATHQVATVWPLLYECCTQKRPKGAHPTSFAYEGHAAIMRRMVSEFRIAPGDDQMPYAKDYNAGLAQVQEEERKFRSMQLTGRVLIVGHSGNGGHFIHDLTGKWIQLLNAHPVQFNY